MDSTQHYQKLTPKQYKLVRRLAKLTPAISSTSKRRDAISCADEDLVSPAQAVGTEE